MRTCFSDDFVFQKLFGEASCSSIQCRALLHIASGANCFFRAVTTAASAVVPTVAMSVAQARPPEIAKYSATTAAEAVDTAVAKSVVEARPPRVVKYSATTAFPVGAPTVAMSVAVAEARPPESAKYRAATEFELAEIFSGVEVFPPGQGSATCC